MSKTKTAAAFCLGFLAGSSKWLWISILLSGVLHFAARFDFRVFPAFSGSWTYGGPFLTGAMAGVFVGLFSSYCVAIGPGTENTGPR